jgi:CheY-like chemotaxis protein
VNRLTEGTGLGLAIVKQLVDMLKGTITVNSKLKEGSAFILELKYKSVEMVSTGAAIENHQIHLRDLTEISLLLVEDNKVNQFLGKQILSKLGFKVKIAGNGKEALDLLNKDHFDLILMDVNMPVMNGYDLTQMIRSHVAAPKNKIPIVALTAYASANEKEKAMALGMNDYVTKPYSPQELLHVIIKQLNLKKPLQEKAAEKNIQPEQIQIASDDFIGRLRKVISGNEADLKKMLDMYMEQIPQINSLIKSAITKKNWDEVYQQSHKLKSSVKVLELSRMSELISMIEEYSKAKENTELISALFEAFKKECSTVMKKMQEYTS